jgi:hypothetical protein
MKIVILKTLSGYKPPKGYRIKSKRKLEDGAYEVTLEPW